MMQRFKNKIAMVTGASGGLGRAISLQLSSEGATLILIGRRREILEDLSIEIQEAGGEAIFYQLDLTDLSKLKEMVEDIKGHITQLDLLVNNAGKELFIPFSATSLKATEDLFAINVVSLINLTRQVLPQIPAQGSIVNIASVVAVVGASALSIYSATKGALISLTRSLALELAPRRVRVNAIAPGTIKTSMTERMFRKLTEGQVQKIEEMYPLGFGTPEDVAFAVAYLGSDQARWITGQTLIVDGGYSIG